MTEPLFDIRICMDCASLAANGPNEEWEPDSREPDVRPLGLIEDGHVAVGDADGFSYEGCDGCGSRLGGDRYLATLFGKA